MFLFISILILLLLQLASSSSSASLKIKCFKLKREENYDLTKLFFLSNKKKIIKISPFLQLLLLLLLFQVLLMELFS